MLIKFRTTYAGPDGTHSPGEVAHVVESVANLLVKSGYAEWVTPVRDESSMPEPEMATREPKENTTAQTPRRRGRPKKVNQDG